MSGSLFLYKIILIGDSGVGKTNLLTKYLKNEFDQNSKSTVGVEFGSKLITFGDDTIKLQIWDTAGQERFRSITSAYYKGAKGAIIVYDITKEESFKNVRMWIEDLKQNGEADIHIIVAGNKSDLTEQRRVSIEDGEKFAKRNNVAYIETSAKNGDNVEKAFNMMIMSFYEKCKRETAKDSIIMTEGKSLNLEVGNVKDERECKC